MDRVTLFVSLVGMSISANSGHFSASVFLIDEISFDASTIVSMNLTIRGFFIPSRL